MLLSNLNRDVFKPFCSHRRLLGWYFGRVLAEKHRFYRGFLQRDASMRAVWSDRQNCSQNEFQKLRHIRRFSEKNIHHHRGNPPFFRSEASIVYTLSRPRSYDVCPFSLLSRGNGVHQWSTAFFALQLRGRATDRERRGATAIRGAQPSARRWVVRTWGRTDLTGFYIFSPVGVLPLVPLMGCCTGSVFYVSLAWSSLNTPENLQWIGFGASWACSLPTAKTRKRKPFRIANGRTICPNLLWFGADAFPLD